MPIRCLSKDKFSGEAFRRIGCCPWKPIKPKEKIRASNMLRRSDLPASKANKGPKPVISTLLTSIQPREESNLEMCFQGLAFLAWDAIEFSPKTLQSHFTVFHMLSGFHLLRNMQANLWRKFSCWPRKQTHPEVLQLLTIYRSMQDNTFWRKNCNVSSMFRGVWWSRLCWPTNLINSSGEGQIFKHVSVIHLSAQKNITTPSVLLLSVAEF